MQCRALCYTSVPCLSAVHIQPGVLYLIWQPYCSEEVAIGPEFCNIQKSLCLLTQIQAYVSFNTNHNFKPRIPENKPHNSRTRRLEKKKTNCIKIKIDLDFKTQETYYNTSGFYPDFQAGMKIIIRIFVTTFPSAFSPSVP